jgi:small subunit ribosomal protein S17
MGCVLIKSIIEKILINKIDILGLKSLSLDLRLVKLIGQFMPRRILKGTVLNLKNSNTAIVVVQRTFTHSLLERTIKRTKKYHVDFSNHSLNIGDEISIQESVPFSKLKRWTVL